MLSQRDKISGWIYFDPPKNEAMGFAEPTKAPSDEAKDAVGKIARLVPGPILGAYGAALGTLPLFAPSERPWVGFSLYVLGIVATAWIVGWQIGTGVKKQRHLLVYTTAFAVWAYSLTGNIALPAIYHPGIGALLPIIMSIAFYRIPLPMVVQE